MNRDQLVNKMKKSELTRGASIGVLYAITMGIIVLLLIIFEVS